MDQKNSWLPIIAIIGVACLGLGLYSVTHQNSGPVNNTPFVAVPVNQPASQSQYVSPQTSTAGRCGMHLDAYCQQRYGYDSTSVLTRPDDARSWACDARQGTRRLIPINMDDVCRAEWGQGSRGIMDDVHNFESWHCTCP
jgi:hypothetical protein